MIKDAPRDIVRAPTRVYRREGFVGRHEPLICVGARVGFTNVERMTASAVSKHIEQLHEVSVAQTPVSKGMLAAGRVIDDPGEAIVKAVETAAANVG